MTGKHRRQAAELQGLSMDQAQVVITVHRAKKGAWVAASRAQGRKLTDWLIERIDATSEASAPCAPAKPDAPLTAAPRKWTRQEAN